MKKLVYLCASCLIVLALLVACTPKATPTPQPTATQPPAPKPVVTATPAATATQPPSPKPPAATPTPAPKAEKITLKAWSTWPLNNPNLDGFRHFVELVNERAKGELEINLMGGPELVSRKEAMGALGKAVMDVFHDNNIDFPISLAADFSPSPGVALKAWADKDFVAPIDKYYRGKANVMILANAANTLQFYLGTTKKPITKLDDLKGLKIRTHGGLSNVVAAALGAAPVTIATAEVYPALERGVVDGLMRPLQSIHDNKEYEVVRNIVSQSLFLANSMIDINQDVWNKLPPRLQTLMRETALETMSWSEKYYNDYEDRTRKALVDKGVKFNTLGPDEYAKWRGMILESAGAWFLKEAGPDGQALVDIVKKYEKQG